MSDTAVTDAASDFKEVVLDIVEKGHDVKAFAQDIEVSVKKSAPWIRRLVASLFFCMSQKAESVIEPMVPPLNFVQGSVCPPAAQGCEQTSKAAVPPGDEPPALEPSPDASVSTDQKEAASN